MDRVARHVVVSGRVQGVFFRAWTREQAQELGVSGWVRNRPDGSVEAHVEGAPEAVEQIVERMRRGPPHANVENLVFEDAAAEHFGSFEVRH